MTLEHPMPSKKIDHVIYSMGNPSPEGEELRIAKMHPSDYFSSIGLTFDLCTPNSVQECWHLFGVSGLPEPTPKWFRVVSDKKETPNADK